MGMFTENGSGGFMSDVSINGGKYGIYGGNQQYAVRNFGISGQTTSCICLLWDWGWTWSGLFLGDSPERVTLINPQDPTGQQAGSIYIMDSMFDDVNTAIKVNLPKGTVLESSIITLDNVGTFRNVQTLISFPDPGDTPILPSENINFFVLGNVENAGVSDGIYSVDVGVPAPSLLDEFTAGYYRKTYFVKSRPQYLDIDAGSVISVKDHGAKGDGVSDDTAAIEAALALATTSNLIYFPAGSYLATSTITIPPHTRILPMIRVGNPGDVGTVEISDMLFTSIGALPGLVLAEWNVQAESPGSVGIWDAHFRVGGAYGTQLQVAQCSNVPSIPAGCVAASMMLHITPESNGYFENVRAWVADHDIDDAQNTMVTVAAARGILIESAGGPTWLYGTASEHSMLYQYNFYNTSNTFAGMIQTESPYFQYTTATASPGPFNASLGLFNNDPDFPDDTCNATALLCNFSWAVLVQEVGNLTIAGAGLYSWFDAYDQSMAGTEASGSGTLVTIGSVETISDTDSNNTIYAKDNTQAIAHPFWSALAGYVDDYILLDQTCDDDDISDACMVPTVCDYTKTFATLDDLQAAGGSYPDICTGYYALGVLSNTLNQGLANYTAVNDGYGDVFGEYVKYTKEMVPLALAGFMAGATYKNATGGAGNQYFDCTFKDLQSGTSETYPCPLSYDDAYSSNAYSVTYTLKDSAGFYKDLQARHGVNSTWVTFGTDIITQALPKIGGLQTTIAARLTDLAYGAWYGPTDDVLQVISMPVFMIQQALESMAHVKAIGEEQAKRDKINLILEILGIVFIFVPFLDDVLPEVEALDGIWGLVAAAGNVGLTIQAIIADPESAPVQLLGLLTAGGSRSEEDFAEMAASRRDIGGDVISKIGKTFQDLDNDFQGVVSRSLGTKAADTTTVTFIQQATVTQQRHNRHPALQVTTETSTSTSTTSSTIPGTSSVTTTIPVVQSTSSTTTTTSNTHTTTVSSPSTSTNAEQHHHC
ncbi:a8ef266c-8802-41e8-87ee-6caa1a908fce [Thermothielavioides terrestris]|uniref:A8ef266c-8802-41e8-87ee-6caa1a908fce n=1 Tax=Thermothielavioides terrestris TaxID=2587410 RepID=A0A446BKH4_9PEZI|nr:a8ef266c-8802-41e8-87ee-6caa1a908fce [Thermothielavioides terrestris]